MAGVAATERIAERNMEGFGVKKVVSQLFSSVGSKMFVLIFSG